MLHHLTLVPFADLTDYLGGGTVVAFDAGPRGHLYVTVALRAADSSSARSSAWGRPAPLPRYQVLGLSDKAVWPAVLVDGLNLDIDYAQPTGEGFLLAACRSSYRGRDDFDRNGRFVDAAGQPGAALLLGDGIASMQVAPGGTIWTSYFDEGVFGNRGWHSPVGEPGLIAWNRQGESIYRFEPPAGWGPICDCYALNVVSDSETWCYYYTGFPLVRIRNFRVDAHWKMPVTGSSAFAVADGLALFWGDYQRKNRCTLVAIDPGREAQLLLQAQVTTPDGTALQPDWIAGRGDCIWALRGGEVFRLKVADIFAAAC